MFNKKYEEVEKEFWDKVDKQIQSRIFEKEKSEETTMKREIEFRGQRADNKEWVYGYLVRIPNGDSFDCYIISDFDERDSIYDLWKYAIKVIPETVGQYTGITDKNGKKIFEHSILLKGIEKVVVKWNSNQCRWGIYSNGYEISGFNESTKDYFEVIGTVFDEGSEK